MATSNIYNPTTGQYLENVTYSSVPTGYQVVTSKPTSPAAQPAAAPAVSTGGTSVPGVGIVNNPQDYGVQPAQNNSDLITAIHNGSMTQDQAYAAAISRTNGAAREGGTTSQQQLEQTIRNSIYSTARTTTPTFQSVSTGNGTTSTTNIQPYQPPTAAPTTPAAAPMTAPVVAPAPIAPTAPAPQAPAAAAPVVGAPAAPVASAAGAPAGSQPGYTGASIVDYLNSTGQASDFSSRSKLAASLGISGYTGTAAQNTQMLNTLRSRAGGATSGGSTGYGSQTTSSGGSAPTGGGTSGTSGDTTTDPTVKTIEDVAKSMGWQAPDPNASPLVSVSTILSQAYQTLGVLDFKTEAETAIKAQTDLQTQINSEKATVNANPWLTEGERLARNSKIDDKYATKLDTLTRQQQLSESLYSKASDQAQWLTGQVMANYKDQQTLNADIYSKAQDLVEKELAAQATAAKNDQATGITGEYQDAIRLGLIPKSTSLSQFASERSPKTVNNYGSTATADPAVLQGMLNQYQTTGQLPTFGLSANNPYRYQFYAALGGSDGQNVVSSAATNKATLSGASTALKTQQNQYAATKTSLGTLDSQLSLVQKYSDQISRTDSPLVNKYLNGVKTGVFGDPDTTALNNVIKTASYEFAKILAGSSASISGATVSSAQDAESLLNSAMSKGQLTTVLGLMDKEANFRLSSQSSTINQIKTDIYGLNNSSSSSGSTFNGITLPN